MKRTLAFTLILALLLALISRTALARKTAGTAPTTSHVNPLACGMGDEMMDDDGDDMEDDDDMMEMMEYDGGMVAMGDDMTWLAWISLSLMYRS